MNAFLVLFNFCSKGKIPSREGSFVMDVGNENWPEETLAPTLACYVWGRDREYQLSDTEQMEGPKEKLRGGQRERESKHTMTGRE